VKIVLLGKNGQVGHALAPVLAALGEVVALDRQACDLADPDALRTVIRAAAPDVIVNAAAYTAVDKAESEPGLAMAINGQAPGILGEEAARLGARVIHYSTDYVFDGTLDRPYVETDPTRPQSVYGHSKLAGEQALMASGADCIIFRTSWVVGAHGGNFAKTILRLAKERETLNVVADQWGVPTPAALIADLTSMALRQSRPDTPGACRGIVHLAPGGETTWHGYACHVVRAALERGVVLRLTPDAIVPIPTSLFPLPAARPANSRLDTARLRAALDIDLPDWQTALAPTLESILQGATP
jgi:dTDP-4-dehydrorhamnose reductase